MPRPNESAKSCTAVSPVIVRGGGPRAARHRRRPCRPTACPPRPRAPRPPAGIEPMEGPFSPRHVAVPDVLEAAHALVLARAAGPRDSRPCEGAKGCVSRSPKRRANARCCSVEMRWSRKKMTLYSSNALPDLGDGLVGQVVAQVDARDLGADGRTERLHAEKVIGLVLSVGMDGSQRARPDVKLQHRSSPSCRFSRAARAKSTQRPESRKLAEPRAPPVWLLRK